LREAYCIEDDAQKQINILRSSYTILR